MNKLNDDMQAMLDCPVHELSDLSISKIRLWLLSKNSEIQSEIASRQTDSFSNQ
jgi:hypothetical protein